MSGRTPGGTSRGGPAGTSDDACSGEHRARGLLIAGTSSDAGKSLIVAGICRVLARRGISVAPFKAQNMSNNSMVCGDGAEIGRAQYLQAQAAGVPAESAMNPVLLKPGTDRRSFIVVRGRPAGTLEAGEYVGGRRQLADAAFAAYRELAQRFDVVVCEGAGSPAEINLRAGDYVNLGLAREFDLPVVVVGDIDRGGMLAALFGTWALLDAEDRRLIVAFVVNKFRGDVEVLRPGLEELTRRTGKPFFGVLPWLPGMWLDSEDSLVVGRWQPLGAGSGQDADDAGTPGAAGVTLRVAVVRFPRVSNATDVDALAAEPGVDVLVTDSPGECAAADLLVLPGTRATVGDLAWLRARGIADVVERRATAGRPVLGICGGYQMLAGTLFDDVESGAGAVPGLGLLPVEVRFGQDKVLRLSTGTWRGHQVRGYEIHHGKVELEGWSPYLRVGGVTGEPNRYGWTAEPFLGGWRAGQVWGTLWHGALECDGFRRAWLAEVAAGAGRDWRPVAGAPGYADRREAMLDAVADAIEANLDVDALIGLAR